MRIAYYSYHCDLPKIWVWRSQNSNQRLLVQQPCKDLALITMKMSLTTTDLNDHWRTVRTLVGVAVAVCGHGIFQYKTFLTFPPFPPMEVEWMTHRPTSPSVHIGKWLVGGKPNCNCSRNWAFWSNRPRKSFSLRFSEALFTFSFPNSFFIALPWQGETLRRCWVSSGYCWRKERRPLLASMGRRPQDLQSFTRSCLNNPVPGLITVKREPRYIVRAGMKIGLNKITSPQMNARTVSAEKRIVGFWGSAILKAQTVIHVGTFCGRRDAQTAKPTSSPRTWARKSNIWLADRILFVCISRMCPSI